MRETDNSDKISNRINELISELSECREDERNTQNQILQVIYVASAILGILYSASYLNPAKDTSENALSNVMHVRVLFLLSLLVFFTAFTYLIVLGTNNILRYYYIQELEDRLHKLIPNTNEDSYGREDFLHWNAYIAPIITRNIKHITSTHAALYYVCYSISALCAVLFSIVMVTSLFMEIVPKNRIDYIIVIVTISLMLLTLLLFLRTSSKAIKVAQFARDTALDNQKIRTEKSSQELLYGKGKSFRRLLIYFIYPKRQDPQKPVLIVLGFIYGMILTNSSLKLIYINKLILIIIVFDFLAYQARYQINDIRGLEEDKEAGCKNRILSDDINNPEHILKLSLIIALIKIIACIVITVLLDYEIKRILLICLGILFFSTLLYEVAKTKKNTWSIFVLVGVGYPLRFFVGMLSMTRITFHTQTICFILALWSFGSFSSILSWTKEVTERIQKVKTDSNKFSAVYQKKHFSDIQDIIKDRYICCEEYLINGKIIPLRKKGSLRDPWNLFMVLCLTFFVIIAYMSNIPSILLQLEYIIYVLFIVNIYLEQRKKVVIMGIGWICILGKALVSLKFYEVSIWYFLYSFMQLIITVTYFILSYRPQIKKIDYGLLIYIFMEKILGKYAVNILYNKKLR